MEPVHTDWIGTYAYVNGDIKEKIVMKRSISARFPMLKKMVILVVKIPKSQNVGESAAKAKAVVGLTNGATLTTASVHYLNIRRRLA